MEHVHQSPSQTRRRATIQRAVIQRVAIQRVVIQRVAIQRVSIQRQTIQTQPIQWQAAREVVQDFFSGKHSFRTKGHFRILRVFQGASGVLRNASGVFRGASECLWVLRGEGRGKYFRIDEYFMRNKFFFLFGKYLSLAGKVR